MRVQVQRKGMYFTHQRRQMSGIKLIHRVERARRISRNIRAKDLKAQVEMGESVANLSDP